MCAIIAGQSVCVQNRLTTLALSLLGKASTNFPNEQGFPRKTNRCCVVAKMVKVTLKKGSGALVPSSCSLHRSDDQWCPVGLSRSIRMTTAAGNFRRRRLTSHPLNLSNAVAACFSCTGDAKCTCNWR